MTSYLFPSSLAPLHVFVIAGQTPAPHVVIWGSDKCLQAVITSGRIHSVSIWKAARRRRCHSLSCQQGELKREEKKLKEKKKRTDKGNFSLTSFPDGKAITRSRLYISARVREGCSSYKHSYNLLRDWGVRRIIYMIWVLLDLTMTSTRLRVYLKWQDRWAASQIATQRNKT